MPRTAAVPSSPPPAGDQARPQRRQRVKVPLRLVANPHYADVAVTVYVKVTALASRPEGCTAATVTIAEYVGLSKSSVERGMTQLMRPGPDGVVELSSTRRSLPGGNGTSAVRRTRPLSATERFVWIPVAASEDLTPRQLRAYALIAYAQAQKIPLTESEIAGALHHHSGRRAGQPLTTAAAGEIVDELEATRWITVERRAGVRGRHHFVAHDIPAAAQDAACGQPSSAGVAPSSTSGPGEGSGPSADAGSLATMEEPRTDRPDDERALFSPAVGEVQVGEAVESRGAQPPHGDGEGGLALRADDHQTPLTTPLTKPSGTPLTNPTGAYGGPGLTISARVHAVLEPVHRLYRQTSVYMQRRIAREVGHQLRSGIDDARLRQRLQTRLCRTFTDEIRDPGRWILGVGLPHWGCGIFDCEAGVLWSSGRQCSVCEEIVRDRRQATAQPDAPTLTIVHPTPVRVPVPRSTPAAPRGRCPECGCTVLVLNPADSAAPRCKPCREEHEGGRASGPSPSAHPEVCAGWDGSGCTRPALGSTGLCVRCRTRRMEWAAS
ncbi:SMC-Scp complex subunit ScpB [Streptomyces sp. NRRL F-5527]|uniref:SMC-Scp complex subunit ScpB n=1 Tax=Streptomyces sp. NRRL F-5527 TaxID=1463862 RepID=UPI001F177F97|nr:SMC-Scp complex subunit ScpB [Streptomyces sp. NRRL F-5527]